MKRLAAALLFLLPSLVPADPDTDGWHSIFDGKSLEGWTAPDTSAWSVEDGAITGINTAANPVKGNQFLHWELGELDDFELKLQFKIDGPPNANSGIQFRGARKADGHFFGYQADIDRAGKWLGALYDEHTGRRLLAARGQTTEINGHGERSTKEHADRDKLLKAVDLEGWNEYHITAQGHTIELRINGQLTAKVIDQQITDGTGKLTDGYDPAGLIALQVHSGPPMKIQFKDIKIKRHPLTGERKKIVFLADRGNHGFGKHEHAATGHLLAGRLPQWLAHMSVYNDEERFPRDPSAFDHADAIILYSNGGTRHPFNKKLDQIGALMDRGVGLMCMHFAVEVPAAPAGVKFQKWIGGYYETAWSSNPIFDAPLKTNRDHPVGSGVKDITINDEWYFNMRFRPDMKGVTSILTAKPPDSARETNGWPRKRYDHIWDARGRAETLMWAVEREDGGRGLGWTGGHYHTNFARDPQRRVLLNALLWVAGAEVPEGGVDSAPLSIDELNQGTLKGEKDQPLALPEDAN